MLKTTQTATAAQASRPTTTTCCMCGGTIRTDSLHALSCPHNADRK